MDTLAAADWPGSPNYTALRRAFLAQEQHAFDVFHQACKAVTAGDLDDAVGHMRELADAVDDCVALLEALRDRVRHDQNEPAPWVIGVPGDHLNAAASPLDPGAPPSGASVRH
jgi:hypothetical protein